MVKKKYILTEGMYGDTAIIAFIASLAIKFKGDNQKIISIQIPSSANFDNELSNKGIIVYRWRTVLFGFIYSFYYLPYLFFNLIVKNHNNIYNVFKHENVDFSSEFKDTLSVKYGIFWERKNIFILTLIIFYELLIFKAILNFVKKRNDIIDLIIIGDTAYRYGYFSKLSSKFSIPIICNIDLNSIYMNYYPNGYVFEVNRPISRFSLEEIKTNNLDYKNSIDKYFNNRTNGTIVQHDVKLAYNLESKNDVNSLLKNKEKKIIVSVFAHIFSDAPRNIPGLLFEDFYTWFVETIKSLSKNDNVYVLIKEHPSVSLYFGEKGLVRDILDTEFPLFKDYVILENYIPTDIISISDFVITASGTIGLEAIYYNKNVIVAADTPYSGLGLTLDFNTGLEYCNYLELLNKSLCDKIKFDNAQLISFIYFILLNNRDLYSDFPLKSYVRGEDFNISELIFDNLINYVNYDSKFCRDLEYMFNSNKSFFIPKIELW
jgi:hypothetical protein